MLLAFKNVYLFVGLFNVNNIKRRNESPLVLIAAEGGCQCHWLTAARPEGVLETVAYKELSEQGFLRTWSKAVCGVTKVTPAGKFKMFNYKLMQ